MFTRTEKNKLEINCLACSYCLKAITKALQNICSEPQVSVISNHLNQFRAVMGLATSFFAKAPIPYKKITFNVLCKSQLTVDVVVINKLPLSHSQLLSRCAAPVVCL